MKIVVGFPPNIEEIGKVFPVSTHTVFAYGDIIYNPSGSELPASIVAHEEVHQRQQGGDVERWWARYLVDTEFRLEMELEAHRIEYRELVLKKKDRNFCAVALHYVARKLSAPLYGDMISFKDALAAIRKDQ